MENTTLQISCILVTRPKLRSPRRSLQLVGVVVDATVNAAVDAVTYSKVTARIGAMIRRMKTDIIMEMVFKKGAMIVYDISVVRSVDVMTPILLDLMPLGSVILALFPCLLNMMIGNCQVILLVS